MDLAPALGLLGLLLVKEAGVPIPVPGDLLVIGAGVAAAGSGVGALVLLGAILAAGLVGGSLQFLAVRGALRALLLSTLRRAGVGEDRLERLSTWLRRRGATGVAVARATPAVRVGAIAASGLAALPFPAFLGGLVVGNGLFVSAHFALGWVIGPPAVSLVSSAAAPVAGLVALVVLTAAGGAAWLALRRRRAAGEASALPADATLPADPALPAVGPGAWLEAACPACLAISLFGDQG